MVSLRDPALLLRMRRNGIVYPVRTLRAARKAKLPITLACAFLQQETGGGRNEWGHDPTIFAGGYDAKHNKQWGETVTEAAYKAYLAQRGPAGKGGMQGVGPCQLTYWTLQDDADRLGGCWRPYPNLLVGFTAAAALVRRNGLKAGVALYNGRGAAAKKYAASVLALEKRWALLLAVKSIQT